MSTPRTYPFAIVNAFTQDPFARNPVTIVFLDPSKALTQEERLKVVAGINQPVVVFLAPTSSEKPGAVVSFDIRYFAPNRESGLCGHGTIVVMKVILDYAKIPLGFGQESPLHVFSSPETQIMEFTTAGGIVVPARRMPVPNEANGEEEDWLEIIVPARGVKTLHRRGGKGPWDIRPCGGEGIEGQVYRGRRITLP